jgi:general secretion pathway protein F
VRYEGSGQLRFGQYSGDTAPNIELQGVLLPRGYDPARRGDGRFPDNTLAILTSSGVPLVDAMAIAGRVVPNRVLRERITAATRQVAEGESLRTALDTVRDFPPLMLHMVASGEASGNLDAMLARVAGHLERDLQRTVTVMLELLKPLMLLVMGGLVLLIVLAILLPILNLNQLVI